MPLVCRGPKKNEDQLIQYAIGIKAYLCSLPKAVIKQFLSDVSWDDLDCQIIATPPGPRYVLMNHHMLLHLKKSVADHGPLWCTSLFVFEDWNGDLDSYFHGTQNIAGQIMTAVTTHQQLPKLIKEMPSGQAKNIVMRLRGQSEKHNRTHLKDSFYAIGAMKSCSNRLSFEDDLLSFLGVESLSTVKYFTRLQAGDTVFHSKMYKRVSRRNSFTVTYHQGATINYGQIEVFFMGPVNSETNYCGAVISPMLRAAQGLCKKHPVLGTPVHHIVTLKKPNNIHFVMVQLENIIDVCVYMDTQDSDVQYAAQFPNHYERD